MPPNDPQPETPFSPDEPSATWLPKSNVPVTGPMTEIMPDDSLPSQISPGSIGPYKLLRKIGKGGMGTVWLAQQKEPVKRRVALKLIRSDIDHSQAIARFAAEREAIGMMDHQNIARILDAGTTDRGDPFFVMEYVDGKRLDTFCDEHRFNIRQRLELMIPVCRAIQHAHHKGIIHRDLKPSNIIVTMVDGIPIPKVIDFGLAKALDQRRRGINDETELTQVGEVVGTLQYLSPEQAIGSPIDTRADIYSLGILLYKLLTGCTPVQFEAMSSPSMVDVIEVIRKKDPPRPSQQLSPSSSTAVEVSKNRQSKPDRLRLALQGDIDWIVMKAIEKDRDRRYETANGLARDIERFLNDDEVSARPPTSVYRLRKFVKRNRSLVISLVTFAVLLMAGIVGTASGLVWALKEGQRANQKSVEAEIAAAEARQAENAARESEARRREQQKSAEAQLYALQIKSAWSDWQAGNVVPAWQLLKAADADNGWEARFLTEQFNASRQILYGHSLAVVTARVSPDGQFLATAGFDQRVRVWNARTTQFIYSKQLGGGVNSVSFSPDSKRIAASDFNNHITIWDVGSGNNEQVMGPFPRDIGCVAFLGDSGVLAAGETASDRFRSGNTWVHKDKSPPDVLLLSLKDGRELERLPGHTAHVIGIGATSDGTIFATGSEDQTVRVFRKDDSGNWLSTVLRGHAGAVVSVDISPDGKQLASCGRDKTARLWDLQTGKLNRTFVGHTEDLLDVAFSPDGTQIVTGSHDYSARVWDLEGDGVRIFRGHFESVNACQFSGDAKQIFTVSDDKTIRVWDLKSNSGTFSAKVHKDLIWQAAMSADGSTIVSGCEDGTISRFDAVNGTQVETIDNESAVLSIAYSPVADIFVSGDANGDLKIRNGASGSLIRTIPAHSDFIWDVAFSSDGRFLASAGADDVAVIRDTSSWQETGRLEGHMGELGSARFSPDGRYVVTCGDDQTVRLWDAETCKQLHSFEGHDHSIWRAVFSPDSTLIASSCFNGEVIIWSVADRKKVRSIAAHANQVAGLTFTPDGSRIVTASDDASARIHDVESGTELFIMRDPENTPMIHASFSADGKSLLTTNQSGWISLRRAGDGQTLDDVFLPSDAVEIGIRDSMSLVPGDDINEVAALDLKLANKCVTTFPSFATWTIKGVAEYRLGRYEAAVASLEEARYLEPIEYGEPDVAPATEAFLALSYLKTNRIEQAKEAREAFDRRVVKWVGDEQYDAVIQEVHSAFARYD